MVFLIQNNFDSASVSSKKSLQQQEPALAEIDVRVQEVCPRMIERSMGTLVYSGKGIFEELRQGPNHPAYEVCQYLCGRVNKFSAKWLNVERAKAVLVSHDPVLLKRMREEFQAVLDFCWEHRPEVGSPDEVLFQTFVGNVIALLPYTYPSVGEAVSLPLKVDGVWKRIEYRVDAKIELSPRWLSSPLSACGFKSEEGPPLLVFLGTTYPAGDGFVATLLSDFTPFLSVGRAPYLYGREEIGKWMEGKGKARLFGVSLGGALCFQTLSEWEEKISHVATYNAPGLHAWDWKRRCGGDVDVQVIYNENDLVGTLGFYPEGDGVQVLRVLKERKENFFKAHVQAYTGSERVTLFKSDAGYENRRSIRKALTALHFLLGFWIVFLPVACVYLLYFLFHSAFNLLNKCKIN